MDEELDLRVGDQPLLLGKVRVAAGQNSVSIGVVPTSSSKLRAGSSASGICRVEDHSAELLLFVSYVREFVEGHLSFGRQGQLDPVRDSSGSRSDRLTGSGRILSRR
ncbi:MAG: hypothetical protein R3B89_33845 [Polyangiaceae bacterium]